MGYAVRTFSEQAAVELASRPQLLPRTHLAVHRDLGALARRVPGTGTRGSAKTNWDHIENITEKDLFRFSSRARLPLDSATIRLRGFPAATALPVRQGNLVHLPGIMASLGLDYQEGPSLEAGVTR